MGNIPYACLYTSYEGEMRMFTDEEVGRLMRALMHYQSTGEELALSGPERYFWYRIKMQHDRDAGHYDEVCEKNRVNGKKGGKKRSEGSDGYRSEAMGAKEKEKENDKEIEKEKESEREYIYRDDSHTVFSPPDINDVISFCQEEGLTAMDPQRFVDYNNMVGWKVKGVPMNDWRAAARIWNSRDLAQKPPVEEEWHYGIVV